MSIIVKLGIQGIRSFGALDLECITFDVPVTLIVGANGSGKTTIIECLKMASTGLLPPNCSGGHCFVHDPQYANAPEVKGQIRMLFRQYGGAEILAIRSFLLTRTRSTQGVPKLKFKALESVLKTGTGENRQSLSQRCADMNVKVPQLMGVSLAILENVIFCHQEESDWPLQDQAALKKKFDAIFGATRYTKALKNIGEIKTTTVSQQKDKKAAVELYAVHLGQVKVMRKRIAALNAKEAEQKKELAVLEEKICAAQKLQLDAEERRNKLAQIAGDLKSTIALEDHCRQQRATIQVCRVVDGDLQTLQNALREKESEQTETEEKYQSQQVQKQQTEKQLQSFERERELARTELAELAAVPGTIAKLVKKQQELWKEFGKFHGEYRGRGSLDEISAYFREEQQSLASFQQKRTEEELLVKKRAVEVDECARKRKAAYDQAAAKCEELQRSVTRITTELNQFCDVDQELEAIKSEIRAITAQGGDGALHSLEGQLNDLDRKKNDLQFHIQRKQENVRQLELQSEQLAEIDVLKKQAREADGLVAEHKNKAPVLTIPIDTSNFNGIRQRVDEWLTAQKGALDKKRANLQAAQGTLSGWEAELKCVLDEEKQLKEKIANKEREVGKMLVADAEAQLAEAEDILNDATLHENYGHASVDLLTGLLRASKKKCELCTRPFHSQEEKQVMADHAAEIGAKATTNYEEKVAAKADAERSVSQKRVVLSVVQAMHQLIEQLQVLSSRHSSVDQSRQEASRAAAAATQAVETLVGTITTSEAWRAFAMELERLETHAATVHRNANDKASLVVALPQSESTFLADEREALARFAEEREAVLRKQESMRNDQRVLQQKKHNQEMQLMERQKKEALLSDKVDRKRALKLEQGQARQELETTIAPVANLKKAMDDSEKQYKDTIRQGEARKVEMYEHLVDQEKKMREVENFQGKIVELQDDIDVNEHKQKNAEPEMAKLARLDLAVDGCKNKKNSHERNVEAASAQLKNLLDEIENFGKNIEVRRIDIQIAEYGRKRQQLEKAGAVDGQELQNIVDKTLADVMQLKMHKSEYTGAINMVQQELTTVASELNNTMYDEIDEKHRVAVLDNEITLIVIQDLAKYHAALDRALMKFHASKMTDINKLVRDMWRQVYRGNDIGYIQMRSDADDESGRILTGAGSRSHNYRVVMVDVHTNAELDMRGRCSAGQKVLASLIIRLALADAFGCQCGVFTLDEPTTNLDKRNIDALAEALAELIRIRSVNDSFQLMIITHDEVFVSMLARHQVTDRYWRVGKDEKGHSKISSDDIRRLMG